MAQAQEEASRTLDLAREKSDRLVERDAIVQAANTRADQIVARARAEAENTRRESDVYIYDSLTQLKREMERILNQVTNGLHTLEVELAGEDEAAAPEMGDAPARPEEA